MGVESENKTLPELKSIWGNRGTESMGRFTSSQRKVKDYGYKTTLIVLLIPL